MNRVVGAAVGAFALTVALTADQTPAPKASAPAAPRKPAPAVAHQTTAPTPAADAQPNVVKQYCVGCHSEKGKAGGLSLVSFDPAHADQNAETAEKMIRKLRAGMMPPPG